MSIDWALVTAVVAIISVTAIAVWRFTRMESSSVALATTVGELKTKIEHGHTCQHSLVKAVSRLSARQKKTQATLERHMQKMNEHVEEG